MNDDLRQEAAPTRIGRLLVDAGKLSAADVARVSQAQLGDGRPFGETAVALGLLQRSDLDRVLARQFGLSPMSEDQLQRFAPELISLHRPMDARTEALRRLRNELLALWGDLPQLRQPQQPHPGHALAVVSTEPCDEGSWLAANLAVVFAQAQIRTGLIDANFRQAHMHRKFGLPQHPGLSNHLASASTAAAPWHGIDGLPHLSVLCAGALPPAPTQLLNPSHLALPAQQWRYQFDLLVLDLPPTAEHADAQSVMRLFGAQALVVARRHRSALQPLQRLYAELERANVPVAATLMME